MTVGIKTLRVGSHILVNGKRERVRGLDEDNGLIVHFPAEYVMAYDVESIPITPELLTELGFEDCAKKRWHTEDWEKRWGGCQYLSFTKLYRGEWRVHYFDGAKDRGKAVVRYLHEAELFLALYNIELIKE